MGYITVFIQYTVGAIGSSRPLLERIRTTITRPVMLIFIVIDMRAFDIRALPTDGGCWSFVKIDLSIVGDRLAPRIIVAIGCLRAAGYCSGSNIHRGPLLATNLDIIVAVDGGLGVVRSLEFDCVSGGWSIVVAVNECAILVYFDYLCVGAHCGYEAEEEE